MEGGKISIVEFMSLDLGSVSVDDLLPELLTEQSSLVDALVLLLDSLMLKDLTVLPLLSVGLVLTEGWHVMSDNSSDRRAGSHW